MDERYLERLRSMSGEERMKLAFELCELMWKVVADSIRNEFPGISECELKEKMKLRLRR